MRSIYRDLLAALAPIATGFGLAIVIHRKDRCVTNITHSTGKMA